MREERRIETMTDNMTTHAAFDAPATNLFLSLLARKTWNKL